MGLTPVEEIAEHLVSELYDPVRVLGPGAAVVGLSLTAGDIRLAADCIEYVRDHAAWEHRAEYGCKCDATIPCDLRVLAKRIEEMES